MESALVRKLDYYLPLTPAERETLEWLERGERHFGKGEVVLTEGEATDRLYVVTSGWLHSSVRLRSEERQILRFHFPGDLMGVSSIAWAETSATLTAVSPCIVSDFPRVSLARVFRERHRLAALLYAVSAADNVAMSDRLRSLGRTDARARIATLLLELLSRLRVIDPAITDTYDLLLTQTEIGDAVGLTKVHVNRTLRDMEGDGMIERSGKRMRIVDEAALADFSEFNDRHRHIATDWFPVAETR